MAKSIVVFVKEDAVNTREKSLLFGGVRTISEPNEALAQNFNDCIKIFFLFISTPLPKRTTMSENDASASANTGHNATTMHDAPREFWTDSRVEDPGSATEVLEIRKRLTTAAAQVSGGKPSSSLVESVAYDVLALVAPTITNDATVGVQLETGGIPAIATYIWFWLKKGGGSSAQLDVAIKSVCDIYALTRQDEESHELPQHAAPQINVDLTGFARAQAAIASDGLREMTQHPNFGLYIPKAQLQPEASLDASWWANVCGHVDHIISKMQSPEQIFTTWRMEVYRVVPTADKITHAEMDEPAFRRLRAIRNYRMFLMASEAVLHAHVDPKAWIRHGAAILEELAVLSLLVQKRQTLVQAFYTTTEEHILQNKLDVIGALDKVTKKARTDTTQADDEDRPAKKTRTEPAQPQLPQQPQAPSTIIVQQPPQHFQPSQHFQSRPSYGRGRGTSRGRGGFSRGRRYFR